MPKIHEHYLAYRDSKKDDKQFLTYIDSLTDVELLFETDDSQKSILHYCAYFGDYETIYLLLDKLATNDPKLKLQYEKIMFDAVNKLDQHKRSPISYCLDTGDKFNFDVVRLLVARGANINEPDQRGWTSLHNAVLAGNLDKVEKLLLLGADINQRNYNRETPLKIALTRDFPNKDEMLRLLFSKAVIIKQKFIDIEMPPGLTDGVIMVGSVVWSDDLSDTVPINQSMPGFEKAITNANEYKIAAEADTKQYFENIGKGDVTAKRRYHYKPLRIMIAHENEETLAELHKQVVALEAAEGARVSPIRQATAKEFAKLCLFATKAQRNDAVQNIQRTPPELRDLINEEITTIIMEQSVKSLAKPK